MVEKKQAEKIRIGIDIGGTFTDFVVYDPASGELETFKLLSTPHAPAETVLEGLGRIYESLRGKAAGPNRSVQSHPTLPALEIVHGSTVATNALLERKGARTALVTTRGFRDVLQIGRQNRPSLYDFFADPPPPLIPLERRFEVDERVDRNGRAMESLETGQVEALLPELEAQGVDSVAVCLLFSFLYPEHERLIAERLRKAGYFVSASHEILPEYREYERTSTTAVNAYVSPIMDGYLARLEEALLEDGERTRLRVMQSNGGSLGLSEARRHGVRCILSGPAGGVVAAAFFGRIDSSGDQATPTIAFDMGGTSTDVSLVEGVPQITTEAVIGGCPIRIPMLDVHTIGAGGGSIASVDAGGALQVGPHSAGADPGPACYGRGGELPTVTDANLVLGRLPPDLFLGGQIPLLPERAHQAMQRLGRELGLSATQTALGVVQVANAHMGRALRVISVERGHDPRRFTLLSFGGAGGLHAADLARALGIPRVMIPRLASTLSAFGMLVAEIVKDASQTVMLPGETPLAELVERLARLAEPIHREALMENVPAEDIQVERFLDMRYQGQSYELMLPFGERFLDDFHALHQSTYGYARPRARVEIVNLRARLMGRIAPPRLQPRPFADPDPSPALLEKRPVVFDAAVLETPLYRAEALLPGNRLAGPAVVARPDTTLLIGPTDLGWVDGYDNLIIEVGS